MFSQRFKLLRQKKGLTQEQIASELSLSRSAVTSYETGSRMPDIYTIQKIADFFEVNTDYLFGRIEEAFNPKVFKSLLSLNDLINKINCLDSCELELLKEYIEFGLKQIEKNRKR